MGVGAGLQFLAFGTAAELDGEPDARQQLHGCVADMLARSHSPPPSRSESLRATARVSTTQAAVYFDRSGAGRGGAAYRGRVRVGFSCRSGADRKVVRACGLLRVVSMLRRGTGMIERHSCFGDGTITRKFKKAKVLLFLELAGWGSRKLLLRLKLTCIVLF